MMGEIKFSSEVSEALDICHHGIKGQKWYQRRFQNPDGSLTAEGKTRYNEGRQKMSSKEKLTKIPKAGSEELKNSGYTSLEKSIIKRFDKFGDKYIDRLLKSPIGGRVVKSKLYEIDALNTSKYSLGHLGYNNIVTESRIKSAYEKIRNNKPMTREEKIAFYTVVEILNTASMGHSNSNGIQFSSEVSEALDICHHGIKGQKWYQRRFQNADGSLTPEGKERYMSDSYLFKKKNGGFTKRGRKAYDSLMDTYRDYFIKDIPNVKKTKEYKDYKKAYDNYKKIYEKRLEYKLDEKGYEDSLVKASKKLCELEANSGSRPDYKLEYSMFKEGRQGDHDGDLGFYIWYKDKYGKDLFRKEFLENETKGELGVTAGKLVDKAKSMHPDSKNAKPPKEEDFKSEKEYDKALDKYNKEQYLLWRAAMDVYNPLTFRSKKDTEEGWGADYSPEELERVRKKYANKSIEHSNSNGVQFSSEVSEALDICHHGIKGQKHGERRFQNYDGTWTTLGKSRRRTGGPGVFKRHAMKKRARKIQEEKRREEAKAAAMEKAKQKHDAEKADILARGKASEVARYKNELTPEERKEVLARFQFHDNLNTYIKKEPRPKTWDEKMKDITDKTNTVVKFTEAGIDVYNTMARIYNTSASKDQQLTLVSKGGGGGGNDNKKNDNSTKVSTPLDKMKKIYDSKTYRERN